MQNSETLIPQKTVIDMTSLSGTTLWRMEKYKAFPRRRKIGVNRVAWVRSEVEQWIASKTEVA